MAGIDRVILSHMATDPFQHTVSDPNLQIDALDGMRGLAILLVLLGHLSLYDMHLVAGVDFSGVGKTGIWLFFVLSAFLLTRPFLQERERSIGNTSFWINYFVRRFLRIFPLYSAILIVSYAFTTFANIKLPFPLSGSELVDHLTLRAGKSILWSVPVEFTYYVLLPFVALAFVATRKNVYFATALVVTGILLASSHWPASLAKTNAYILGPYLPIFLLGTLAALINAALEKRLSLNSTVRHWFEVTAWFLLVVALATIPSFYNRLTHQNVPVDHFHDKVVFFGLVWSAYLISVLQGTGAAKLLLCFKPLRYLGSISFSVYLWHLAIIQVVDAHSPLPPGMNAWIVLCVTVLLSSLTYFAIEKPCLKIVVGRSERKRSWH
jgi:peptidoglycan/LPS O-acetylase OafA/YrhL